MLPWRYNSDVENTSFLSFHFRALKSKSKVVEKVTPVADFWISADDMCQKL